MSPLPAARGLHGEVLRGLDDPRRSLGRQGSGEEGALPGPGVPPQLRGGEAEDPAQPEWPGGVHVRARHLPVAGQARGAVRVPLAGPVRSSPHAAPSAGRDGRRTL